MRTPEPALFPYRLQMNLKIFWFFLTAPHSLQWQDKKVSHSFRKYTEKILNAGTDNWIPDFQAK